jgi:hypothetical protein
MGFRERAQIPSVTSTVAGFGVSTFVPALRNARTASV